MKFLVVFVVLGTIVCAKHVPQDPEYYSAYGYMERIGIPEAERIRKAEEAGVRIVGGVPAALGQYPFMAGILGELTSGAMSFCGGSLISSSRVLTGARCWFDGINQAMRLHVVLGSVYLFSGGIRVVTSTVVQHPKFSPYALGNDVAVAYFASPVELSATIAPVSLPRSSEVFESFAGEKGFAVGIGANSGSIGPNQVLNHVSVDVLDNYECLLSYPFLDDTYICTSSDSGGFCTGDSGAPLVINWNNRQILIGIFVFGSAMGCQSGRPHGSLRVTSYLDFINQNM